ncbi:MAG: hypothetical protein JW843_10865 [Candidatus Aminicenantes bacterium]|nr:hypothetical protein [Candidatus Aminicenantes bacterium]
MAKSKRAYKSAKRSKELDRLRKREEKRKKKLAGKPDQPFGDVEAPAEEEIIPSESSEDDPIIPGD